LVVLLLGKKILSRWRLERFFDAEVESSGSAGLSIAESCPRCFLSTFSSDLTAQARPEPQPTKERPSRRRLRLSIARKKSQEKAIMRQLSAIEEAGGAGTLDFSARSKTLKVSYLTRSSFTKEKYTKGDVLSLLHAHRLDFILPTIQDRPLVLKRSPMESIFFVGGGGRGGFLLPAQGSETTPPERPRPKLIETRGGEASAGSSAHLLTSSLYDPARPISVDPWHSRLFSLWSTLDYAIIDLILGRAQISPAIVQSARWAKEVIDVIRPPRPRSRRPGSTGLHIYSTAAAKTPNEAATLVAQVIATKVANGHPRRQRSSGSVKGARKRNGLRRYCKNIQGRRLPRPYCVEQNPEATGSRLHSSGRF